ncbi:MAG: type II secretion system protein GspG [Phycisphaerae bacterium]|nr:type II secretion system protein GspG [Phycisphaerae bacterium]
MSLQSVVAIGMSWMVVWFGPSVAEPTGPYARTVSLDGGARVRLEMAAKSFEPPVGTPGPRVTLAAAIHVGDAEYYRELQAFLDAKPLVLYEGVRPAGTGVAGDVEIPEAERPAVTRQRLRYLAVALAKSKADGGGTPDSLEQLASSSDARLSALVRASMTDGWGRRFVYAIGQAEHPEAAYTLESLGADGVAGGLGADEDICWEDQPPLTEAELGVGSRGGVQRELARALGLVFQGDTMDHDRPNWRNSDMAIDQIRARVERAGGDAGVLLSMLDGSSFSARAAQVVLRIVSLNQTFVTLAKAALLDVVAVADAGSAAGSPSLRALMRVIVEDRNQVVVDDLAAAIREDPARSEIAIVYGGGHMPDLERRVMERLGYHHTNDIWFAAIDVDIASAGITPAQMESMRASIRRALGRVTTPTK